MGEYRGDSEADTCSEVDAVSAIEAGEVDVDSGMSESLGEDAERILSSCVADGSAIAVEVMELSSGAIRSDTLMASTDVPTNSITQFPSSCLLAEKS